MAEKINKKLRGVESQILEEATLHAFLRTPWHDKNVFRPSKKEEIKASNPQRIKVSPALVQMASDHSYHSWLQREVEVTLSGSFWPF